MVFDGLPPQGSADRCVEPGLEEVGELLLDFVGIVVDPDQRTVVVDPQDDQSTVGIRQRADRLGDLVGERLPEFELRVLVFAAGDAVLDFVPGLSRHGKALYLRRLLACRRSRASSWSMTPASAVSTPPTSSLRHTVAVVLTSTSPGEQFVAPRRSASR